MAAGAAASGRASCSTTTGEIATNAHVVTTGEGGAIKRARAVYVEFADGNQVQAKIVGTDPNADVALLKIDPNGPDAAAAAARLEPDVEVGAPVAAIGSPFGERQSLSVGVVSAVDRSIDSLTSFSISGAIQTDAAINPGNSGGPLVDAGGRVSASTSRSRRRPAAARASASRCRSTPSSARSAMLRDDGEARYAYLGVSSVQVYPQLVDRFDLAVGKGAWVQEVNSGGPAERAGIHGGSGDVTFQAQSFRPGGDVITKVAGKPVEDSAQLADVIAGFKPGDTVPLEIHRDGKTQEIRVKLGERPLSRVGG